MCFEAIVIVKDFQNIAEWGIERFYSHWDSRRDKLHNQPEFTTINL
jgi:hypothetical protein